MVNASRDLEGLTPSPAVPASNAVQESAEQPWGSKWRRWLAPVLLGLFVVLSVLSLLAIWTRLTVFDTDVFVHTVAPLSSDADIQIAVSQRVANEVVVALERDSSSSSLLAGIAGVPLRAALEDAVSNISLQAVQSPRFSEAWETIATLSHDKMVLVVEGGDDNLLITNGGEVAIDLTPIFAQINESLAERGIDPLESTPLQDMGLTIVLFQSDDLAQFQEAFQILNDLAVVLPLLTLLSLFLYFLVSTNRWHAALHSFLGLGIIMILVLVALRVVRWRYLSALDPDIDQAAAAAFFDTLLRYLRGSALILAVAGMALAGVVALVQPEQEVKSADETLTLRQKLARSHNQWLAQSPALQETETTVASHRKFALLAVLSIPVVMIVGWDTIADIAPELLVILALAAAVAIFLVPNPKAPDTTSALPQSAPTPTIDISDQTQEQVN